jgi:hypothetical protein
VTAELHSYILWPIAFVGVWLIHAFHENPHVYNSLQAEVEFVHRSATLCTLFFGAICEKLT